jgi:ABC-type polysaccharide/polyol phosphate export permease
MRFLGILWCWLMWLWTMVKDEIEWRVLLTEFFHFIELVRETITEYSLNHPILYQLFIGVFFWVVVIKVFNKILGRMD